MVPTEGLNTGTQVAFNVGNTARSFYGQLEYLGERTYTNRKGYRTLVKDKADSRSISRPFVSSHVDIIGVGRDR